MVSFCAWVSILYTNIQSAVINNGHFTEFVMLEKGVRQGCPLSVYLFILVAELLSIKIRSDDEIKGIQLAKKEVKISQLADDKYLFLSNPVSIKPVFNTLKSFDMLSGLKANLDKTRFYNIGATEFSKEEMCEYTVEQGNVKLLGLTISKDLLESQHENFSPRVKAMENILKQWSKRKLSLKGKITVINALALSLIVYPATILEVPSSIISEINAILYKFLWDGKRPKIAAKVLEQSIRYGGLKMPNLFLKVKA